MALRGCSDFRPRKLRPIEAANLIHGIAALKCGSDGAHASKGRGSCAFFLDLGAGIDIDAQILDRLVRIFGCLYAAKRSFDFDVIAFLRDMRIPGEMQGHEGE